MNWETAEPPGVCDTRRTAGGERIRGCIPRLCRMAGVTLHGVGQADTDNPVQKNEINEINLVGSLAMNWETAEAPAADILATLSRVPLVDKPSGVQGSGYRVQGAGCRVQGAGCRVQGAGCRVPPAADILATLSRVPLVDTPSGVQCAGFRVHSSGCRVQGAGCRVQGAGFRLPPTSWRPFRAFRWSTNPKLQTPNPQTQTPNPKHQTLNPKP